MSEALYEDAAASDNHAAVRNVVDLVAAAPGAQYAISDLAAAAGVGARQLQKLFHDRFGMGPSEYVRNVRLDGSRSDLLRRDPAATVSDIAFRWGSIISAASPGTTSRSSVKLRRARWASARPASAGTSAGITGWTHLASPRVREVDYPSRKVDIVRRWPHLT